MKPLIFARKNIYDLDDIQTWFQKLERIVQEKGILDSDIYNIDETGFRIGVGRAHKVIIRLNNERQFIQDSNNRDYIILVESISAAGVSHALLIILKSTTLIER
jgi:hypothetical protein